MSKVFAQSVRDAILLIYKDEGVGAHHIPNHARRTLLRNGLADLGDADGKSVIVLTKVGRFAREILLELGTAINTCDRMKETALSGLLAPIAAQGRSSAIPATRRVGGDRPAMTCGTGNHDSFAVFLASLEAAGKNRWKQPGFMGQDPRPAPGTTPAADEDQR